jgi:hypothetical protein
LLRNIEIGKFKLPSDVSGDCKDLLRKMIEKDPKGKLKYREFSHEQRPKEVLEILGYYD